MMQQFSRQGMRLPTLCVLRPISCQVLGGLLSYNRLVILTSYNAASACKRSGYNTLSVLSATVHPYNGRPGCVKGSCSGAPARLIPAAVRGTGRSCRLSAVSVQSRLAGSALRQRLTKSVVNKLVRMRGDEGFTAQHCTGRNLQAGRKRLIQLQLMNG